MVRHLWWILCLMKKVQKVLLTKCKYDHFLPCFVFCFMQHACKKQETRFDDLSFLLFLIFGLLLLFYFCKLELQTSLFVRTSFSSSCIVLVNLITSDKFVDDDVFLWMVVVMCMIDVWLMLLIEFYLMSVIGINWVVVVLFGWSSCVLFCLDEIIYFNLLFYCLQVNSESWSLESMGEWLWWFRQWRWFCGPLSRQNSLKSATTSIFTHSPTELPLIELCARGASLFKNIECATVVYCYTTFVSYSNWCLKLYMKCESVSFHINCASLIVSRSNFDRWMCVCVCTSYLL